MNSRLVIQRLRFQDKFEEIVRMVVLSRGEWPVLWKKPRKKAYDKTRGVDGSVQRKKTEMSPVF